MTVDTNFEDLKTDEEKVITFINGIMGLEQYKKYLLLNHPGSDTVKWLQALNEPGIALPVADPLHFYPDYAPKISREELLKLDITSPQEAIVLCVLTISKEAKNITMNLKAPIVINPAQRIADQFIAENPEYDIRQPINITKNSDDGRCKSC